MKDELNRLKNHIDMMMAEYSGLDEELSAVKLSQDKWSVKEIIGHLVDSAANNYQRFLRLQESRELNFPGYDYNWVELVRYNSYPFCQILELWKQYNLLLCHIIENIEDSALEHCWVTGDGRLSLSFLITDYIDHMELHIRHLEERLEEIREAGSPGMGGRAAVKELHHICVQSDCYEDSLNFYTNILGFKILQETPDFRSRDYNTWLESEGFRIELQTGRKGQALREFCSDSRGIVHLAYRVEDIEGEYDRIRGMGCSNFKSKNGQDIYSVKGGRLFKLIAPEGTVIEFRDKRGI